MATRNTESPKIPQDFPNSRPCTALRTFHCVLTRRLLPPPTVNVSTTAAGRPDRPWAMPPTACGRTNRCGVNLDGVAAVGRRIVLVVRAALVAAEPIAVALRAAPCASSPRMFRLTGLLGVLPPAAEGTVCMRAFFVVDTGLLGEKGGRIVNKVDEIPGFFVKYIEL